MSLQGCWSTSRAAEPNGRAISPDPPAPAVNNDVITSLVISSGSEWVEFENGAPRILLGSSNGMWRTIRSYRRTIAAVPTGPKDRR